MFSAIGGGWRIRPLLSPDQEQSLFIVLNALRFRIQQLRRRFAGRRLSPARANELRDLEHESEAIRRYLVEANVRLVVSVASKMTDPLLSLDELCGEGLLILLKAIDGFDFSRGFRFSTYATNSLQRHFFRLKKRAFRKQRLGQPVSSELLGVVRGADGVTLPGDDPVTMVRRLLVSARSDLDPRERRILELRFGLNRQEEHTLREIAAVLRISKERVRQVLARAVGKLQAAATRLRLDWTPREMTLQPRLGA